MRDCAKRTPLILKNFDNLPPGAFYSTPLQLGQMSIIFTTTSSPEITEIFEEIFSYISILTEFH